MFKTFTLFLLAFGLFTAAMRARTPAQAPSPLIPSCPKDRGREYTMWGWYQYARTLSDAHRLTTECREEYGYRNDDGTPIYVTYYGGPQEPGPAVTDTDTVTDYLVVCAPRLR